MEAQYINTTYIHPSTRTPTPIRFRLPKTLCEFPSFAPTAAPPVPPNWSYYVNEVIPTIRPFKFSHKFPLPQTSVEYQTLQWMVETSCNMKICEVNQLVNPELMENFISHRKEMIMKKTTNMEILAGYNLPDDQLENLVNMNQNFAGNEDPTYLGQQRGALVQGTTYSDNTALLFHCTRGNLNKVLDQGLDERVARFGLLGRGIYFSDDPLKAISYDTVHNGILLVFMVLIGDAIPSTSVDNVKSTTQEPPKMPEQCRTARDIAFDSIAGCPRDHNEYIIYDRCKCVPVYEIKYKVIANGAPSPAQFSDLWYNLRRTLPNFIWKSVTTAGTTNIVPGELGRGKCPILASTIFTLMESYKEQIRELENPIVKPQIIDEAGENDKLGLCLSSLKKLEYYDEDLNKEFLLKYNFNMDIVTQKLSEKKKVSEAAIPADMQNLLSDWEESMIYDALDESGIDESTAGVDDSIRVVKKKKYDTATSGSGPPASASATSATATNGSGGMAAAAASEAPTTITCSVCYNTLNDTFKISGSTMTGICHSSQKCTFCSKISGIMIGTCPDGTMNTQIVPGNGTQWIQIKYHIPSYGINRTCYLPSSPEGEEVLDLLKIAFDRRLTFKFGPTITSPDGITGAPLVWNIHHKTALSGGEMNRGYPDPGYLGRVRNELKQFGIQ